jgi:hypothetical protein
MSGIVSQAQGNNATEQLAPQYDDELVEGNLYPRLYRNCNSAFGRMMIRIITIEREYGSGAAQIAKNLAAQLGWKLWEQLLTQEIARLAHCEQSVVEK